ncbi:Endoribonuclease MazF [termite gut metagenome]|uniref:Endoribonuclease MazF n=1 Tax=termite gut metagenome TaxID=433724 RepID=A0A5J4SIE2_9ZZZZ
MGRIINQYDVFWVKLDPTQGSEMAKTRPCVVVSPNEIHNTLRNVIVIPITSSIVSDPCRVDCCIAGKKGKMVTYQIRSIDKSRLGDFIGTLSENEIKALQDSLKRMLCR